MYINSFLHEKGKYGSKEKEREKETIFLACHTSCYRNFFLTCMIERMNMVLLMKKLRICNTHHKIFSNNFKSTYISSSKYQLLVTIIHMAHIYMAMIGRMSRQKQRHVIKTLRVILVSCLAFGTSAKSIIIIVIYIGTCIKATSRYKVWKVIYFVTQLIIVNSYR